MDSSLSHDYYPVTVAVQILKSSVESLLLFAIEAKLDIGVFFTGTIKKDIMDEQPDGSFIRIHEDILDANRRFLLIWPHHLEALYNVNFRDESLSKTTLVSNFRSDQDGYYLSIIEAQDNGLRPFINVAYSDLRIPHAELIRFQQAQETPSETRNSIDDIIRKLTLKYESDESFIMQFNDEPGKSIRYDDRDLKFKTCKTTEWEFFLKRVLKSKQPIKVNERQRKRMWKVEDKLRNLLGKLYDIDIPQNFKLFYHDETDELASYKTIFKTALDSEEITFIDKDDFNEKFTELLTLLNTKRLEPAEEATFLKYLQLGKDQKYLTNDLHKGAMEKYNMVSLRLGDVERIPRSAAIASDPDLK